MSEPLPSDPSPVDPQDPNIADPAPSDPPADPPSDPDKWGENWRQDWVDSHANDEGFDGDKALKRLERYAHPGVAIDGLIAAQNRISSGDLKSTLQADASDEEKTQWRTENGVPEKFEDYEIDLPNGLIVGEEDKPMVDSFLESAHASNLHPDQVNGALAWYYDHQDQLMQQQEELDATAKQTGEDALRVEWGTDYRRNLQIANNLLDQAPGGLKEQIMGARLADGSPLGNNPETLNWLVDMSRQINPLATVVPGSGANAAQAIESELATLKGMMGDRQSEYWKGPNAQKNQARCLELIEVLEKTG